ncbi:DUF6428 family protein [Nonlabens xiamenensis]|uniref:DUF6428 family protein n=1 Tax=Nonlabens xiamenensis TaxID=2341043 RepID=UPI000F6097E9|nr:DUF6428 family protein [Nonlabens xiamenensis]
MNLSTLKDLLSKTDVLQFQLENGQQVPAHFHVTEVGKILRHFVDCGGTERLETKINFQLWTDDDTDHRLSPQKLLSIISMAETTLGLPNAQIEVEYQSHTIGKYLLEHDGTNFHLVSTATDCLAKEACGISPQKPKIRLSQLSQENSCAPGSGCC